MLSSTIFDLDHATAVAEQLAAVSTRSNAPIFLPSSTIVPSGSPLPQTAQSGPLINHAQFLADSRFAGIDGSGFATVIIDTGIDLNHPFFGPDGDSNGVADRIVYQQDFADGDMDASDYSSHGSNVASIAASQDATQTGMAPAVDIIALKVFETTTGSGVFSYIESALQWVVANVGTYNIASVNMSIGDGGNYDMPQQRYGVDDELATLAAANVIVASASGNNFFPEGSIQGVTYPSADPNSLSVGAVYDASFGGTTYSSGAQAFSTSPDRILPLSQRHATLTNIFAPGSPITGANKSGGTITLHGTSQASPHVAGIAVLAQQLADQVLGRRLTPAEFTQMLSDTAVTINDGDDEDDNVVNTGLDFERVDVLALGEAILALGGITGTTLPYSEDFEDVSADFLIFDPAVWQISADRFEAAPPTGQDAAALLDLSSGLPAEVRLAATINSSAGGGGKLSNAMLVFDEQGPTDFKFAGGFLGTGMWRIGHVTGSSWTTDAFVSEPINADTDYRLEVHIEGTRVSLLVDTVLKVSHDFTGEPLTDGQVGLAVHNATSRFDDFSVRSLAKLPLVRNFASGASDPFEPQLGTWFVNGSDRYRGAATSPANAVSLLDLDEALPSSFRMNSIIRGKNAGNLKNGVHVFDYSGPNSFKYAGGFFGANQWRIGHFDGVGWTTLASASAVNNTEIDYDTELVIRESTATLSVDGAVMVSFDFAGEALNEGRIGLGTHDGVAVFDDLTVAALAVLPIEENFDDGEADFFVPQLGTWFVNNANQYHGAGSSGEAISLLDLYEALPSSFQVDAIIRSKDAGNRKNAVEIFDFEGPNDFKYAGGFFGANQWRIGHYDGVGWNTLASLSETIDTNTPYALELHIEGSVATLWVDGVEKVNVDFSGQALNDGQVGLATHNAVTVFDDFSLHEHAALPYNEDFNDGKAEFLGSEMGTWSITTGRYHGQSIPGGHAISLLDLGPDGSGLPGNFRVKATLRPTDGGSGFFKNAIMIFHRKGAVDFKYAGAFVGAGAWRIGHYDGTKMITDDFGAETINLDTDYVAELRINGTVATLSVGGVQKASFDYGASLSNGQVGLGTRNAVAEFDDLTVEAIAAPTQDAEAGLLSLFASHAAQRSNRLADYHELLSAALRQWAERPSSTLLGLGASHESGDDQTIDLLDIQRPLDF